MSANGTTSPPTVGIIGLGIMGMAYARNLRKAGFAVVGYDPMPAAAEALRECGGEALASPRAVAERCDHILIALASVPALHDVVVGADGIAGVAGQGMLVGEMGTLPIDAKEKVKAALEEGGAVLLDCPVSGTGGQAAVGDLVIYASGDKPAFDAIRPSSKDLRATYAMSDRSVPA